MLSRRDFLGTGTRSAVLAWGGAPLLQQVLGIGGSPAQPAPGGTIRAFTLRAAPGGWDVGRGVSRAWTYNGRVPGPELRVREGDLVRVTLVNQLPQPTTIHWHGIPVPFAMDGVPELTQEAVAPGRSFTYEFRADHPGTYWYHSHFGYQFERGLFGALVVEPRRENLAYDREYTLVLDDWMDDAEHPRPAPRPYNGSMGGMSMGGMEMRSSPADGGAGNGHAHSAPAPAPSGPSGVAHPASHGVPMPEPVFDAYTVNGRTGSAQEPLLVRRGERVRLRLVNASTAVVFPVYVAGHRMTVTHSDGQPLEPFEADVLPVGMGERFDVIIHADNPGVWALASTDPSQRAKGVSLALRYQGVQGGAVDATAPVPRVSSTPYRGLAGIADGDPRPADREYPLVLQMMGPARWTINGRAYPDVPPLEVRRGERVRLRIRNQSMFAHPMHLHGHFVDLVRPYGAARDVRRPLRKDTLTLYHMDQHTVEFTADNPGARWFLHCHNQYHHVGGMGLEVRYL